MELVRITRKYFQQPEELAAAMKDNEIVIENIPNTEKFLVIKGGLVEEYDSFEDLPVEVQNVLIDTDREEEDLDEPTRMDGLDVDSDEDEVDVVMSDVDGDSVLEPEMMMMHSESKVLKFKQFNKINESKALKGKSSKRKVVKRKSVNENVKPSATKRVKRVAKKK